MNRFFGQFPRLFFSFIVFPGVYCFCCFQASGAFQSFLDYFGAPGNHFERQSATRKSFPGLNRRPRSYFEHAMGKPGSHYERSRGACEPPEALRDHLCDHLLALPQAHQAAKPGGTKKADCCIYIYINIYIYFIFFLFCI